MRLVIPHISHMCCISCMCVCVHACTLTDSVCMDCRLPTVKTMLPRLTCVARELSELHEAGLVHQAVHQDFVLVRQAGEWQLAETYKAARMDSSLDKPM